MAGVASLVDRAVHLPPGAELAAVLEALSGAAIPNARRVELLQARARQLAYAHAEVFAELVELSHTVALTDLDDPEQAVARAGEAFEWAAHEIAAALTWTPTAADRELGLATALVERLPLVQAALHAGRIDRAKARVFADYLDPDTGDITDTQAQRLCEKFVPLAPALTTKQLSERLLRALHAIDPHLRRRRYERAVQARGVALYLDPRTGTATLVGDGLPADEAAAAATRLDRLVEAAKRAGHPATRPQIAADLYLGMLNGVFHRLTEHQIINRLLATHRPEDQPHTPPASPHTDTDPNGTDPDSTDPDSRAGSDGGTGSDRAGEPDTPAGPEGARPGGAAGRESEADRDNEVDRDAAAGPGGDADLDGAGRGGAAAPDDGADPEGIADPEGTADPKGTADDPKRTADPKGTADPDGGPAPGSGPDRRSGGTGPDGGPKPGSGPVHRSGGTGPDGGSDPGSGPVRGGAGAGAGTDRGADAGNGGRAATREGIEIRVGLATLAGLDDRPGEIPGLGPIGAHTARTAVTAQHRGAAWKFAIVDTHGHLLLAGPLRRRPRTTATRSPAVRGGIVELHLTVDELHHHTTNPALTAWAGVLAEIAAAWADRHRIRHQLAAHPTARFARGALADHIRIRDRTCIGPGCTRPARRADLDHTHEHHRGGPTTEHNIGPACKRHHPDKDRGWTLTQPQPGQFHWTSPLGRTYHTQGEPIRHDLPNPDPTPDAHQETAAELDRRLRRHQPRILERPTTDPPRPPPPPDPHPPPDDEPPPF